MVLYLYQSQEWQKERTFLDTDTTQKTFINRKSVKKGSNSHG